MRASIALSAVLAAAVPVAAEPATKLQRQAQADLGLAVIGLGYEVPIAARLALQLEGQIFGTYFLPWFDAGDDAKGLGAELRATWFARPSGRGLYVLAYGRLDAVRIDRDDLTADGVGVSAGAAVGWAFRLTRRLDLRVGAGAQYIYLRAETQGTRLGASTPFPTLDGVLGYRL
jgi:hypothetical protein